MTDFVTPGGGHQIPQRDFGKSRVARAADKARRAQEGPGIVTALVETDRPARKERCVWCGGPAPKGDGVCVGHRDLGGIA